MRTAQLGGVLATPRAGGQSRLRSRRHLSMVVVQAGVAVSKGAQQDVRAGTRRTTRSSSKELVSSVRLDDGLGSVNVAIEAAVPNEDEVRVLWGVYRASPNAWQFPKAIEAPDTVMDDGMGAMSTAMHPTQDGNYAVNFRIPSKAAPLTFAYALHARRGEDWRVVTPMRGGHFTVQIGVDQGVASRLGPSVTDGGMTSFAVHCRGGEYVNLVLVRQAKKTSADGRDDSNIKIEEFALDPAVNRSGTVWHAAIKNTGDIVGYGWRVNGDLGWEQGARVAPDTVLLDPESPQIKFLEPSDDLAAFPRLKNRKGEEVVAISGVSPLSTEVDSRVSHMLPEVGGFGMVSVDPATFGWDIDGVQHPGTFLGISEAVQYFITLGIRTLVIRYPYALAGGRAASFFAPDPCLAATDDAGVEFKLMVDSLHTFGIRVVISIDLTLTAEGSDDEPNTMSWRGLDNSHYFRANGVFNCGNPVAQEHVVRALRHWVLNMGVDGFEFVYAENMAQNMDEVVMDAPALPDALAHDPVLSSTTLIAAPFNESLLPRQGERGFPHWGKWLESNGQKGTSMTYFLSPDNDVTLALAASIAGRPHLFSPSFHGFPGCLSTKRPIQFSINALDSWDAASIASTASSVRALMLADGIDVGIPTAASVSRAILASIIFSSGTPSIPSEAVGEKQDTLKFVKDCLTCRSVLANLLDCGSVGTWHGPTGQTISLHDKTADDHFLGRFVSCHAGALYLALNPENRPIPITLPGTDGDWQLIVDSYTGEVSTSGAQAGIGRWTMMSKSVSVFVVRK